MLYRKPADRNWCKDIALLTSFGQYWGEGNSQSVLALPGVTIYGKDAPKYACVYLIMGLNDQNWVLSLFPGPWARAFRAIFLHSLLIYLGGLLIPRAPLHISSKEITALLQMFRKMVSSLWISSWALLEPASCEIPRLIALHWERNFWVLNLKDCSSWAFSDHLSNWKDCLFIKFMGPISFENDLGAQTAIVAFPWTVFFPVPYQPAFSIWHMKAFIVYLVLLSKLCL